MLYHPLPPPLLGIHIFDSVITIYDPTPTPTMVIVMDCALVNVFVKQTFQIMCFVNVRKPKLQSKTMDTNI